VAELLTRLERRHAVTHLRLDRLGLADTSALLEAVSGRPPSYRAALSLHNRTGGNPFFLEELLRAGGENGLDLERLCDQPLPWNLAEALRRQLDDLDPGHLRVVEAAAVLGRKIPFDLLAVVTQLHEGDLIAVLRELVRRGLLIETGEDEFSFRHALTREAVADQLLGRERRRLHALALDALLADPAADPSLVAHHARGAGRYDDLVAAARRGWAEYLAKGSAHQALTLAELGLEEAPDDIGLLAGAAQAAWLAGLVSDAEEHAQHWLRLVGTPDERSPALRLLVRLGWEGRSAEEMGRRTEEICELIDQLTDDAERARAMATVAQAHMLRDFTELAVSWADRAVALADEQGLPAVRLAAEVEKGSALIYAPGRADDGRKLLLDVAGAAERAGEWLLAARALHNVVDNVPSSLLFDARELLERMRVDAERAGFESHSVAMYFQSRARLAMEEGDLGAAVSALDEAHRRDRGFLRSSRGIRSHEVFRAGLALEAGDLDRAGAIVDQMGALRGAANVSVTGLVFHLACRRGDRPAAEAAFDDVMRAVEATGETYGELVHDLVSAGLTVGMPPAVLRPLAKKVDWSAAHRRGWQAIVEAQFAEAEGRPDEALNGYVSAAGEPLLRPAVRATAHTGAARCLIALGRVDEARTHVAEAGGLLTRWTGWRVAEVETLRGRVGLPVPGAVEGVAGLTPREREVAALIAEGLTNAELARRLYISKKTAAVHVSNILGKLGVASRTQVAASLREAGPPG
jgi:DNA-binding CsgD family transcriptional regulator